MSVTNIKMAFTEMNDDQIKVHEQYLVKRKKGVSKINEEDIQG